MKLGDIIRTQLAKKNMTQTDLARKINIGQRTISNYINNKSMPDLEILAKICEILEIDIHNVLGIKRHENDDLYLHDKNEYEFIAFYRSLSEPKKAHFTNCIHSLMDLLK